MSGLGSGGYCQKEDNPLIYVIVYLSTYIKLLFIIIIIMR